ncbi:putative DNA ligase-like protein Mb0963 [Arthrobacter sp. Hiyo8]|nr:putative DNA ligase-like protein Mb0963 [Arthrobacter sp. Hiyo8]
MATSQKERVNVEGHELTLTNLGKIIYPETGTTKAEVLEYYAAVAPFLIPAAANRPATRKRWVHGVGTTSDPGPMFFQKNLDDSTPSWVPRVTIQHREHSNVYPLVNNLATLTWLAQIAALEIHVPQWQVDADGTMLPPDRLVLDLDPGPGTGLSECVEVAKLARSILQDIGLDPVPVTSGSKGIHLYAGLDGTRKWEQVSAFAHELARSLEADHPDLVVSDMKKTLRNGKVLVDWSQNSGNKTTIVPYSLRGRAHPMVAARGRGANSPPPSSSIWTSRPSWSASKRERTPSPRWRAGTPLRTRTGVPEPRTTTAARPTRTARAPARPASAPPSGARP